MMWVKLTLPPRWRARWLLMTMRLSTISLAGTVRTLVAVGTLSAYLYSVVATFLPHVLPAGAVYVYYEAAVVIVVLILLGRYLEARAKGQTSEAIRALARLQPKTAHVERDGATQDIDIDDVRAGDIVLVRPGERIPTSQ